MNVPFTAPLREGCVPYCKTFLTVKTIIYQINNLQNFRALLRVNFNSNILYDVLSIITALTLQNVCSPRFVSLGL